MTDRRIALLRGVNVGAHRRIAMGALRELLADLGYADVRTHLQSGNVVLTSRVAPAKLERDLERQIADGLGVETRVIVRTREELQAVIERNPLAGVATDPKRLQVTFLSAEPDAAVARELAEADISPEQLAVSGREIYVWYPDGVHNARANKVLTERRLGVAATARNWNTVTRLLALAGERYPEVRA